MTTINDNGIYIIEKEDSLYLSYLFSASDEEECELHIKKSELDAFLKKIKKSNLNEVDISDLFYDIK